MLSLHTIRTEARAMLALAAPVIVAQLSQMGMGVIDTLMVAPLGNEQLGAAGIGSAVYFFYMVFGFGILSAVGPMVAHAFGAGDNEEIDRSVGQGFWMALVLGAVGLVVCWNIGPILRALGQAPAVIRYAEEFVEALSYGLIANLLFSVLRVFCDGVSRTRVAMVISFVAMFLNAGFNYLLIYGRFGFPALGVAGSGYATSIVRWMMLAMMAYYVFRSRDFKHYRLLHYARRIDPRRIWEMLRLGVPIGAGHSMENGVFGFTSMLMGQISTVALASHQVAINVAAVTFMVPLGVSIATSTRVGQAIGRREPHAAALAGWTGMAMAGFFMCCTGVTFLLIPRQIIGLYTDAADVLAYASTLLMIAGAFQFSDGIQVAAMGALRGLKDTTRPMIVNLIAYWIVGLPVGYLLAFRFGYGGSGLWWGLTIGLTVAALLHSLRFRRMVGVRTQEVSGVVEVTVQG
jgi:MATE family multidrug resistance protein